MYMDEEKETTPSSTEKHDYYSSYFDDLDKDEDDADTDTEEKSQKITIEDPKEENGADKKFDWTNFGNLSIISAFMTIALIVLGKLFVIVGAGVVHSIFFWMGGLCLLASLGLFVAQMIKNRTVKFDPQLTILILAIISLLLG